jgi:hypothetical protein
LHGFFNTQRLRYLAVVVGAGAAQVPEELDFTSEEFSQMSAAERIRLCRLRAERAWQMAALHGHGLREKYLALAEEWDTRADEIEHGELPAGNQPIPWRRGDEREGE